MVGLIYSRMAGLWSVLLLAGVVLGVIFLAQRTFIYFPVGQVPSPGSLGLRSAEIATFSTDDDLDLEAWFVPARDSSANRTIIVFSGNAGNRASRVHLAATFAEYGWSTLLVDYRGYGGNPGLPSEAGLERDARAALKYVLSRTDVDPTRIVYFGESLGAAVAIRLAADYPPAALILRSPFSSMTAMGTRHYPFLPVRWLLRDRFASIDRIGHIKSPTLFIAGDSDTIVPLADTQLLFDAANEPKRLVIIPDANHNDEALFGGAAMMAAIRAFLE